MPTVIVGLRTDSRQCSLPDLPWCDSQNPLKTNPLCPTVRVISTLTSVENSVPQWEGGGRAGQLGGACSPQRRGHCLRLPTKAFGLSRGGSSEGARRKSAPCPLLWGGANHCETVLLPQGVGLNGHSKEGSSPQLGEVVMTIVNHSTSLDNVLWRNSLK